MKKKIAVRTALASAVIAPVMVFGTATATAVPALSAGASGEVKVTVPVGESWNCFAFDSNFGFKPVPSRQVWEHSAASRKDPP